MSQSPPNPSGGPPRPINEDFPDFEGDPTSINQIPNNNPQGTPRVSMQHPPQPMNDTTTTRSPTWCWVTSGPISTISPMNSCPNTSPFSTVGM